MADDFRSDEQRAWDALGAGAYLESARLYGPLAVLGSETALVNLGWMHSEGHLGPPDLEQAISFWEEAAGAGSATAKHHLRWAWRKNGDLQRARAIFLESAEQGCAPCMSLAGTMLVRGEGGVVDSREGVAWLTRAANGGDAFARRELLRLEEQRAWDALDAGEYLESARLFEPLAAFGSETALLSLGWMYWEGHLGPPDLEKAISLFEKAASAGSAVAKHYLGWALKDKGDLRRARAIFLEGAEQGYTPCMYWAGRMLMRGEGGDADLQAGVAWLTRGADGGHAFCRRALFGLEMRNSASLSGRLLAHCKMIWYVLGMIPRLVRDPRSPDFR